MVGALHIFKRESWYTDGAFIEKSMKRTSFSITLLSLQSASFPGTCYSAAESSDRQ